MKLRTASPISLLGVPGLPARRSSSGTNTKDSELTDWLRDNGADEDTVSQVKETIGGAGVLSRPHGGWPLCTGHRGRTWEHLGPS